jgi:hypothetical protein
MDLRQFDMMPVGYHGRVAPSCCHPVACNSVGTRFVVHRKVPPQSVPMIAHLIILPLRRGYNTVFEGGSWKLVASSLRQRFPTV